MNNTTDHNWPRRVAVLGVGLLGGSVALSIRRNRPDVVLAGTARDANKCARLTDAGIVDEATTSIEAACRDSDVVVVATPVDRIVPLVIESAAASPDNCLITDVGSTKAQIVDQVGQDPVAATKFVGAHPIAGSEKTGFQHARADLFDGKVVVLTPGEQNDSQQIQRSSDFWHWIGGEIHTMSAAEHDTHLAAISHVPHLVSALVTRLATDQSLPLAGSGWQDITRVAAGDPAMWTAICRQNRTAILSELERLSVELDQLKRTLDQAGSGSEEAVHHWLAEAKRIKEQAR